jgi:hypothetical protein
MPTLIWNEIRARATTFTRNWRGVTSEQGEAQTFWNEFFQIFGVTRRRVAVFEKHVEKLPEAGNTKNGRIDVFWPGTLLAEHKSAGKDLDGAFKQALDYFAGLKEGEIPRYVVVSDFARFRYYDLDEGTEREFKLADLPKRIHLFGFIAGYQTQRLRDEDPINERAVRVLGDLHDALKQDGYTGEQLEVFLVRLVFCFFADDTGIFNPKDAFLDLIETHTKEDGSDTGGLLAKLFEVLNTPESQRQKALDEDLARFPHVNGRLFEQNLRIPDFNRDMRQQLIACCGINWAAISPAIFGAMFQKVIELDARDRRRQLGAHYTSEKNILKLIGPLFLDELRAEFEAIRNDKNRLFAFQNKLRTLAFLDPACGCGNFLVVTYRELRRLELDVIRAAQQFGHVAHVFEALQVNVDQFYGIEIEEFPAQIAQVALWLTDHQMNVEAGREFGDYFARIPLETSATIRRGNALRLDWEAFVPPARLSYILGNPPFIGKQHQDATQKEDLETVTKGIKGAGVLDFVAGWYLKAAHYLAGHNLGRLDRDRKQFQDMRFGKKDFFTGDWLVEAEAADERARAGIRCAFVSTNSITQGEQVGVLWSEMLRLGLHIQFAHRTFKWSNEAPGKAAVHCVIVGFGRTPPAKARLFEYADPAGDAHETAAARINPYLVDAPEVVLPIRREPVCKVPAMVFGSMPNDGGHLLLDDAEKSAFLAEEPGAERWIRPFLGAEEFINGIPRWCLWLKDVEPAVLRTLPKVLARVDLVKRHRQASKREATRKLADTPRLFGEDRQPEGSYLLVPSVSSEGRSYIPIGFLPPEAIASNLVLTVPEANFYHFGLLTSTMHMAWVRYVCGRLESRYRYSAGIVYNNFPWPDAPDDERRSAIEQAAQDVLEARAAHAGSTLADLYDPLAMPDDLRRAHKTLDRAVDAAYQVDGGKRQWADDGQRVAFLFARYQAITSLL